jgi:hypothetical protein
MGVAVARSDAVKLAPSTSAAGHVHGLPAVDLKFSISWT